MIKLKTIKGFPKYAISNTGEVFSMYGKGMWLKPALVKKGRIKYYGYHLVVNGKRTTKLTHRLLAENYLSNPDNLPLVEHINDINIAVGKNGKHLAEHGGYILIGHADTETFGAFQVKIGEINRVFSVAVFKEIFELVSRHHGAILFCFIGACADMWHQDNVFATD